MKLLFENYMLNSGMCNMMRQLRSDGYYVM